MEHSPLPEICWETPSCSRASGLDRTQSPRPCPATPTALHGRLDFRGGPSSEVDTRERRVFKCF